MAARRKSQPTLEAEIENLDLTVAVESAFLAYSMSVIAGRALPDVRDGLKPVHRRILWSMSESGYRPDRPYVKCARVVGNVIGKFHPHGDSAVYETLVRLAQPFSLNVPLIDPHGNFGSPADPPAAARYCVVGDTRVRTADGDIRIADISPDSPENSETDISLKVYDRHGALVEAEKFFHSGVHPTFKVVTESGRELAGTGNHLLLVASRDDDGAPVFVWKTISQLVPGDYCVVDRTVNGPGPTNEDDVAIGLLAGALISEGWASATRSGFNNTDKEFFDLVLDAWDKVFGGSRYLSDRLLKSGKPTYEIDCQYMDDYEKSVLGEMIGFRSREKRIPEAIWQGSGERRRWFLKAAFEGDGSACINKSVVYCSSSYGLLLDIQLMLLGFGIVGRVRWNKRRETGTVSISNRRDLRLFHERVGFLTRKVGDLDTIVSTISDAGNCSTPKDVLPFVAEYARKNRHDGRLTGQNASEWITRRRIDTQERWEANGEKVLSCVHEPASSKVRAFTDHGYYFDKVETITPAGPAPVYSLRLRSDERAFITNGFVSHNTECRLAPFAVTLLEGIDEDTVDLVANYDGSENEPVVVPARVPNLLINGTQGIAVGLATNIPPHNPTEVIDAALHLLDHPDATIDDLTGFIHGPDFPTGGRLLGSDGYMEAYRTGRGRVRVRAVATVETVARGDRQIVVTEIPYQTSVEDIAEKAAALVDNGTVAGVRDIRDESADGNTRLVFVLRPDTNVDVVLANLYKHTPMQTTFGMNLVALDHGIPRLRGIEPVSLAWKKGSA